MSAPCCAPDQRFKLVPIDQYVVPIDQYVVPIDQYVVPIDQYVIPIDQYVVPIGSSLHRWARSAAQQGADTHQVMLLN